MAWIAGVDGCKGGWIAVYEDTDSGKLDCRVEENFEDVMACRELAAVAVDMPIGLSEEGYRACDKAARDVLGKRSSSIFSAPAAGLLPMMKPKELGKVNFYRHANELSEKLADKGLSRQSWALVPKIAEVAGYLKANPLNRVYEAHPEVCFAAMKANGGMIDPKRHPMRFHKATAGGSIERREMLTQVFKDSFERLEDQLPKLIGKHAALDDFYDALACLWTARSIQKGPDGPARALCGIDNIRKLDIRKLSGGAPTGADGLPMRIVY